MYLVDTNVISEASRGTKEAVDWLRSVNASDVYLSVITLGEIMRGIALMERYDPKAAANLTQWLQGLRRDYADRILPIIDRVAVEWGRIGAIRPHGDADGLIAATALVHELILVTRNVVDFEDIQLPIINPWDLD